MCLGNTPKLCAVLCIDCYIHFRLLSFDWHGNSRCAYASKDNS